LKSCQSTDFAFGWANYTHAAICQSRSSCNDQSRFADSPFVLAYWRWQSNLWPYVAAQYFSILLVGLLVVLFRPRCSRSTDLLGIVGLYALARTAEALDARIFAVAHIISGHTLKHLIAAIAVLWLLRMLVKRSPGVDRPT
jgi:hypothetical protein